MRFQLPRRVSIGRETGQLLLILVVSAAVLVLLARLRFPGGPEPPAPSTLPLERLAARATYEELATIVAELDLRLGPALIGLRVQRSRPEGVDPSAAEDRLDRSLAVPAVRFRPGLAMALLAEDERVRGVAGDGKTAVTVVGRDAVSGLTVLKVGPGEGPGPAVVVRPASLSAPRYALVADATFAGATLWPAFIGRIDATTVPGWDPPLLLLGGTRGIRPGAFLFSLDGGFAGVTLAWRGEPVLVPPDAMFRLADDLVRRASSDEGDIGIEVQALTPALVAATGSRSGAIISVVDPGGPASGLLEPGDVVEMMDGRPVLDVLDLRARVARARPGTVLTLSVRRDREQVGLDVAVRPVPVGSAAVAAPSPTLGVTLQPVRGTGARIVTVAPGSVGARAGLEAGDTIVRFGRVNAPSSRQVLQSFGAAAPGTTWLVVVARDGRHLVVAVEKP